MTMSALSYGPRENERIYPRDAWRGWRPIALTPMLTDDFDDEPALLDTILASCRRGRVETADATLFRSGDSWQAFARRNYFLSGQWDWDQLRHEYVRWDRKPQARARPVNRKAQTLQEKWEAERREAELAKQREADRLWAEEEQRRRAAKIETERKRLAAELAADLAKRREEARLWADEQHRRAIQVSAAINEAKRTGQTILLLEILARWRAERA